MNDDIGNMTENMAHCIETSFEHDTERKYQEKHIHYGEQVGNMISRITPTFAVFHGVAEQHQMAQMMPYPFKKCQILKEILKFHCSFISNIILLTLKQNI